MIDSRGRAWALNGGVAAVVKGRGIGGLAEAGRVLGAALALLLCLVGASALRSAHTLAPSAADSELLAVHAALDDLRHEYFRPVDSAAALNSAWDAALGQVQKAGADAHAFARPNVDGDVVAATHNFDAAFRRLSEQAPDKVDARTLGHAALAGLASSVHENHTYFIGPEGWNRRSATSDRYAGIGVTIAERDHAFYIAEVFARSPAARAGFRAGDRLTAVDAALTAGLTQGQLVQRVRGQPGAPVTVMVERAVGSLQATLVREQIVIPAFESRVLDGGVGYLRLRSFPPAGAAFPDGHTLGQSLDAALAGFEQAGVAAWVLDLRGNGGGYLDAMTEVAGRLLPSGTPVLVSHTQNGDAVTRTAGGERQPVRPLTVLINGGSASASEILAAALQESGRAAIVGEQSAGVANAANLDALPDGGGISITSVLTLTPVQRRPLDGQGVTPDSLIAGSADDLPLGRDRQLEQAAQVALSAVAQSSP